MKQRQSKAILASALFLACASDAAWAQFGGRHNDVVLYAVTYNGPGEIQTMPPTTTNSAAVNAGFKVVSYDSLPGEISDPFPLVRRVFYMTSTETFQVGTDVETTVGLHRVFVCPTKIFQIEGVLDAGGFSGFAPTFLNIPQGLDLAGDISLETLVVITWFPKSWPFIALTETPGPLRPPNVDGFQYLFGTPGLVTLPSLLPWTSFASRYPGLDWKSGTDFKLIDADFKVGDTIRMIRLRPGAKTPIFRTAGHTHYFVLSGSAAITPAGGSPLTMKTHDYVLVPENTSISVSNPVTFQGTN